MLLSYLTASAGREGGGWWTVDGCIVSCTRRLRLSNSRHVQSMMVAVVVHAQRYCLAALPCHTTHAISAPLGAATAARGSGKTAGGCRNRIRACRMCGNSGTADAQGTHADLCRMWRITVLSWEPTTLIWLVERFRAEVSVLHLIGRKFVAYSTTATNLLYS